MSPTSSSPRMVSFPPLLTGAEDTPATLVATSAYGHDAITTHGQAAVLPWLNAAGADGVEIRRERLPAGLTRAIEYPLQGQDLVAITTEQLARLRRL